MKGGWLVERGRFFILGAGREAGLGGRAAEEPPKSPFPPPYKYLHPYKRLVLSCLLTYKGGN